MTYAIISASVIAVILLIAALLVVWSRRDIPFIRGLTIPAAVMAACFSAAVVLSTLGHATPLIGGVTAPSGDAPLLSVKFIVNKGIYLTLDVPGEPKLFWLPWSNEMAEAIQALMDDPANAGVMVEVPPFEWSWDIEPPQFQPLPQPKWLPNKPQDAAPSAPHFSV